MLQNIHRDFSSSLGINTNYPLGLLQLLHILSLMHSCVLKWPQTARSPLSVHKCSIHTYTWLKQTLLCMKDMHNRAHCYVTCNCQLKLSVHSHLDEHIKPCLEKSIISTPVSPLARPTSPLRHSLCSFPNKLVFTLVKTSDSSLHSYQKPRPTGRSSLGSSGNIS